MSDKGEGETRRCLIPYVHTSLSSSSIPTFRFGPFGVHRTFTTFTALPNPEPDFRSVSPGFRTGPRQH